MGNFRCSGLSIFGAVQNQTDGWQISKRKPGVFFLINPFCALFPMNFNALKYVEELRNAGMPEKQAEAQIRVLNEVVDSELASKQNVETVREELKRDIKELELKIETVREELKRDIKELELRLTHTLTMRLGGLMALGIILIGILVKVL